MQIHSSLRSLFILGSSAAFAACSVTNETINQGNDAGQQQSGQDAVAGSDASPSHDAMAGADAAEQSGGDAATMADATSSSMDATTSNMDATSSSMDATATGQDAAMGNDAAMSMDASMGNTTCNPTFGSAEACGGDPVGNWAYQTMCANDDPLAQVRTQCPGAMTGNILHIVQGTLTIRSDMTFTRHDHNTITTDFTLPPECAAATGGCTGIAAVIQMGFPGSTVTCSGASTCSCHMSQPLDIDDFGTYSVSGGVITANPGNPQAPQYYFCVNGNVLDYSGVGINQNGDTYSYVLTR
jgi:hypothetical protein